MITEGNTTVLHKTNFRGGGRCPSQLSHIWDFKASHERRGAHRAERRSEALLPVHRDVPGLGAHLQAVQRRWGQAPHGLPKAASGRDVPSRLGGPAGPTRQPPTGGGVPTFRRNLGAACRSRLSGRHPKPRHRIATGCKNAVGCPPPPCRGVNPQQQSVSQRAWKGPPPYPHMAGWGRAGAFLASTPPPPWEGSSPTCEPARL